MKIFSNFIELRRNSRHFRNQDWTIFLEDQALPTLTYALETAFLKSASVFLIIVAKSSAISKRNNLYVFFDSHSHGGNSFL